MVASHVVEVTDEEINCFKENGHFSLLITYAIILKQLFTSALVNIGE